MADDDFFDFSLPANPLGQGLQEYRLRRKNTDVVIRIGDREYWAHKFVLELTCLKMANQIKSYLVAPDDCVLDEKYVSPKIVEDLLTFLYTSKVRLSPKNVFSFIKAAEHLDLRALRLGCLEYLGEHHKGFGPFQLFSRRPGSCYRSWDAPFQRFIKLETTEHDNEYLSRFCVEQIEEFIEETLKILDENSYDKEHKTACLKRLFEMIIYWVNLRITERSPLLRNLLKSIRYLEMEDKELQKVCKGLVKDMKKKSRIYCFGDEVLSEYSLTRGWIDTQPEIVKQPMVTGMAAAVLGKHVYLFGGETYVKSTFVHLKRALQFDSETKEFRELAPMPEGRVNSAAATLGQYIYVAGGLIGEEMIGSKMSSEVLRYDTETDQWSTVASMVKPRRFFTLVNIYDLLYAVSGSRDDFVSIEVYDPETDQWSLLSNLPEFTCEYSATAHHDDKIYICGEDGFARYHPSVDNWEIIPIPADVYRTRFRCGLVSFDGLIWAIGGATGASIVAEFDRVYTYDSKKNEWKQLESMSFPRDPVCYNSIAVVNYR